VSHSFAVKQAPGLTIPARLALALALAVGLTLSLVPAPVAAQDPTVLYVTPGGSGDCSTWATACTLQAALTAATSGDEVWVAEGTHTPGTIRSATFQLKSGVAVYGGFAGTETTRSERDWVAHPTVLSGDVGTPGDNSDNAYHVVTGSGTDATAVLDGFTITGGNANGSSRPNNCGGGMYNVFSSSPTLTNVTFSGNSAGDGGGGGGMCNDYSSPTLTNVTFSANSAAYRGGGMVNYNSSPTLINVTFSGNSAAYDGGGMFNLQYGSLTLTNVTFSGNSASDEGGGMYNEGSNPTLTNCILWGNTATTGYQIYNSSSTPSISYSDVQGSGGSVGWDTTLGTDGGGNIDADPLFVVPVPTIPMPNTGGDLRLHATSPAVDAGDDTAVPAGITTDLDGNPRTIGDAVDMGAYETLPAVISITRAGANPTNAASVPFTVTLNVRVVGVDTTAFALTTTGGQGGTTLGTVSGVSETWTVAVSTVADATGTIRLDLLDTDTITATPGVPLGGTGAGNGDFAAGEVYTIDWVAPTVSLASTAPDPTNLTTIPVTVTFGEEVTGFTAGDVTAGNGTVANFAGSGAVYTFDLIPGGQGPVTADVAAGVAQDGAGNGNTAAAQFSRTYDSVAPTVTIDQEAGQPDPTGTAPISFTVVFDEPVTGFDGGDVTLSDSTTSGSLSAAVTEIAPLDGTTYHVAVSGMTGPGEVVASIAAGTAADLAGNPNAPSTSTDNSVTFDPDGPVVISLDAPDVTEFGAAVYTITVVYADNLALDVSSLDEGDLRVTGPGGFDQPATFAGVTPSGDGTPRTATYHVTPPGGTWDDADRGAYTVALVADQVRDTLGNAAAAGTLGTFKVGDSYVFLPLIIR
jgi:hypothetical protein